ncbi:MAG: hypothetical protein J7M14_00150 [Planctomycetes bacterium]|nr:hypothetical protein [Planctomycetota bacterium]
MLELTLALSLMVMLVSLTMVTVGRSDERRGFRSAAERIGTLFRMARAESAGRGRRFRIAFAENDEGDKLPAIVVLWEAEPLAEPGQFTEYTVSTWSSYIPVDDVRVLSCTLIGPSAYRALERRGMSEDEDALQSITFYPDGSSDSALLELAPIDPDDTIRSTVRLDGVNGTAETLELTETELEENRELIAQGLYDPAAQSQSMQ